MVLAQPEQQRLSEKQGEHGCLVACTGSEVRERSNRCRGCSRKIKRVQHLPRVRAGLNDFASMYGSWLKRQPTLITQQKAAENKPTRRRVVAMAALRRWLAMHAALAAATTTLRDLC